MFSCRRWGGSASGFSCSDREPQLAAHWSLEEPGGARRSQKAPGGARRSQEEPGGARGDQEEPGGARGSQRKPGGAERSKGAPGGAREGWGRSGGARRSHGESREPRRNQKGKTKNDTTPCCILQTNFESVHMFHSGQTITNKVVKNPWHQLSPILSICCAVPC